MAIVELSEKKYKNGRRPFTAILYELQPPDCVVDDVGTKYNKNGITFLEEYCAPQLDSIKDMSVTVSFLDDERTMISGHGMTGIKDGMPIFDNATTVGHFTEGYIDNIESDGETKRVVIGKGYLDEMRYSSFVEQLEIDLNNGISVEGSIEIYKAEGNDGIVYKKGYLSKGRIPVTFIHAGWSLVSNPADSTSSLVELNEKKNKKEEEETMDMNEVKSVIQSTISELNDKSQDYEAKIADLNAQIEKLNAEIENKNNTISELNVSVGQVQAALDKLNKDHETYWAERAILEKELAKAKVAEKLGELNLALGEFNDEEKEIAKDDIEKLTTEINSAEKKEALDNVTSEINSIKSKICMNIVAKQKQAEAESQRVSELNAKNSEHDVDDIFSEICSENKQDDEDLNIF
jgi:hypothetical protein